MIRFNDRPIRIKILMAVMLASFVAVFVAGAAFLTMNILNSNRELQQSLQNNTALLAVFSEAPLDFNDATTAEMALNRIVQDSWVIKAGILRADGSRLARFSKLDSVEESGEAFEGEDEGVPTSQGSILVQTMQVYSGDGRHLGSVYLAMDMGAQRKTLYQGAIGLTGFITICAWAAATLLTIPLQRIITEPILNLKQVAQQVSRDSGRRAAKRSGDEIGDLVDEFNLMLDTIEARERDIREQESEYQRLVENVNIGICRLAADQMGTFVQANPAAAHMLGMEDAQSLLGVGIEIYFSIPDEWRALRKILLAEGQVLNHELAFKRKDGQTLWCSFSARMRESGKTVHASVMDTVLEDITERKLAEIALEAHQDHLEALVASRTAELELRNAELGQSSERLSQTNEELKTFAYIVSHDLRAPLVNLKGFAAELEFAVAELKTYLHKHWDHIDTETQEKVTILLDTDMTEALQFISSSVTRMDGLLNSILKLSRIGRREMNVEEIEVVTMVEEILRTLAHQLDKHHVQIEIGPLPTVKGDRVSIDQIFGNLLDNAVKFLDNDRPGKIEVSGREKGSMIEFIVRDNGRGMSANDMTRIFDIFRRVGPQDRPGDGMGLSYVRTLVRRHGGEIYVESEPDKGSAFIFTLRKDGRDLV